MEHIRFRLFRSFCWLRPVALFALLCPMQLLAGGPRRVAGVWGFNAGLSGTTITWANGVISYYTDQGDLSPVMPHADADALVADAFSRWTSVSTAAVTATQAGQLDEDVNSTNVTRVSGGLSLPLDIQAKSAKPVAIVYDADGAVTNALLGDGAFADCDQNAVIVDVDRYTPDAHFAHALVVLNGNCVPSAADVPAFRYRLVRALGALLGLDWSQLNDNVVTGNPSPTSDDYAGFPLMHYSGALCSAAAGCLPNADQLRMDDRAAVARLYPATSSAEGKQAFSAMTARVRGSVRFPAWQGTPGQGMQGANVIARLIDPNTKLASRAQAASSVSGFLFRGNAGNVVTGYTDATGQRFDQYGGNDPDLEGFFDLAGLEIPAGSDSAQYQLTVEPIAADANGNAVVGPYKDGDPALPGSFAVAVVTLVRGGDVPFDLIAQDGPANPSDTREPQTFSAPAPTPGGGYWSSALASYGDVDYYSFFARAGRTFSIEVTATDSLGTATTQAPLPVIGLWVPGDIEGSAPITAATYFNSNQPAMSRLPVRVINDGQFTIGIADYRGDGRPDYFYRARILYADSVSPTRASTAGNTTLTIKGTGFLPDTQVAVGEENAPVLALSPDQIIVTAPLQGDGTQTITVSDPVTGAYAEIENAVTYGSGTGATVALVSPGNPLVPVGAVAPYPFRVRVIGADGQPVQGAHVFFNAPTDSVSLSPCAGRICNMNTDAAGEAAVTVTVKAAGPTVIQALLSDGVSVSTTVTGSTPPLAIVATPPALWIMKNSTSAIPLSARVLKNGAVAPGTSVEFDLMLGAGKLSPSTVVTNSNGDASTTLTVTNPTSEVRVTACVMPGFTACDTFHIYAVDASMLVLEKLGLDETLPADQSFDPLWVRVIQPASPPNAMAGVPVHFQTIVYRMLSSGPADSRGESTSGHFAQQMILATADTTVYTDANGLVSITPSYPASMGQLMIEVHAGIANGAGADFLLQTLPPISTGSPPGASPTGPPMSSRSGTRGASSAASAPSVPRRGSTASSKESSGAAVW